MFLPSNGIVIATLLLTIQYSETNPQPKKSVKTKFGYTQWDESDPRYWYGMAKAEIRERMDVLRPMNHRAKNVVFFLGDGMGISTITAARIFKGQLSGHQGEEGYLEFDRFPYTALIKTYNLDKQVPDSAGTATAYLTGVKANYATLGVSSRVSENTLDCDLIKQSSVSSILEWALDAGKAAGVVTTTRITHATPGASYSHVGNRDWEANVPVDSFGKVKCKDIASQLVEDYPGNRLNVILGGGRRSFIPKGIQDPKGMLYKGKLVPAEGRRLDGRNMVAEWLDRKAAISRDNSQFRFVNNTAGLRNVDLNKVKYLMGLFNYTNMEYEQLRDKGPNGEPSLTEMTETAIKVLMNQGKENGFVLLVEGGRIDHAHHDGYTNLAMYETIEFDRAIRKAREMLPAEETLFVVTADHSHGMTISGYPKRGNPITGLSGSIDSEGVPYTTLMYANGPGYMTLEQRLNKVAEDTKYLKFQPHAGIHIEDTFHGGEDVAVFGTGPMAHFFGGTHEQSYIAHVVGFAACIGAYRNETHCRSIGNGRRRFHNGEYEDENEIIIRDLQGPTRYRGMASSRSLRLTNANGSSSTIMFSTHVQFIFIMIPIILGTKIIL
ncbi:hypothetical protein RDWZM_006459 [Blomia tropicalis]|uniref:Alkaline phosphatase n=1 Tax=Blomia tropicalis TaxID=40697 RepID=A0A9Q0M9Q0_BLOTA|nr:hypothetical protein RDWZM_006459 [Blomia tropicalis]